MSFARKVQFVVSSAILLSTWQMSSAQQISITGGNLVMTISSGAAGSEPIAVTNSSDRLQYKRQNVLSKVTVSTSCAGQRFSLSVAAVSPTDGTAMPVVNLQNGAPATDLIRNVPPKPPAFTATSTLLYTAWATFSQGNSAELGNDVHTITYTLTAQ